MKTTSERTPLVAMTRKQMRELARTTPLPEPIRSSKRSYKAARIYVISAPTIDERYRRSVEFADDLTLNGARILFVNAIHTNLDLAHDLPDLDTDSQIFVHYGEDELHERFDELEAMITAHNITAVIFTGFESTSVTQRHKEKFASRLRMLVGRTNAAAFVFAKETKERLSYLMTTMRGPLGLLLSLTQEFFTAAELLGGSEAVDDEPMHIKLARMRETKKKFDDAYRDHVKHCEENGIDAMTYEELTGIPARYVIGDDDLDADWVQSNEYLRSEADVLRKARQNRQNQSSVS